VLIHLVPDQHQVFWKSRHQPAKLGVAVCLCLILIVIAPLWLCQCCFVYASFLSVCRRVSLAMQSWSDENLARTRSARHKLLKFLRDHSALHTPKAALQTPPAPHLETMEILDNSLRQPLDQGRAVRAEPLAVKSKSHWLTVECVDKPGSLAEIACAIAQHEQNIKVSLVLSSTHDFCSFGV
jgi:hypothetical protein